MFFATFAVKSSFVGVISGIRKKALNRKGRKEVPRRSQRKKEET
jgi:hypothetical protein